MTSTEKGLVHYQPLTNRRNEPIPFLEWVPLTAVVAQVVYPPTIDQLLGTFYSLARVYGLRLCADCNDFSCFYHQLISVDGLFFINTPTLYLLSHEQPDLYLAFNWQTWLQTSKYLA